MKNIRLALETLVSNGRGFDLFVRETSLNPRFHSPFSGVRLANTNNDPYGGSFLSGGFHRKMVIIIVLLLCVFFFMFFFSIYILRGWRREARRANAQAPRHHDDTRGLDRAVIESFPVFSYDLVKGLKTRTKETLECVVCLNEFKDDEMLRLLPQCSHAFHAECIDTWLFTHTTCPVCRTSLVPTDDGNKTGTGHGIIELPDITPSDDITIAVDGEKRDGSVRRVNDVETPVAPESADNQESLGVMGLDQAKKFSRSHSTGHSLVRLHKDSDQSATEWYICTAEGLTPGLHKNCSTTARARSPSQQRSNSKSRPALSKQDSLRGADSCSEDAGTSSGSGSGRRWYEHGLRSERLSISSMNPSSLLRTHSEHRALSYSRNQESSVSSQQERNLYVQSLKNTLKRLTGKDREWTNNSQSGRGSSRRATDNLQSGEGSPMRVADESGDFTTA